MTVSRFELGAEGLKLCLGLALLALAVLGRLRTPPSNLSR